uniref:Uncharacterized protein n=1 Tax=Noccaea caerulescens TaxID=107243 RepID=A0A1J3J292_NOCCA
MPVPNKISNLFLAGDKCVLLRTEGSMKLWVAPLSIITTNLVLPISPHSFVTDGESNPRNENNDNSINSVGMFSSSSKPSIQSSSLISTSSSFTTVKACNIMFWHSCIQVTSLDTCNTTPIFFSLQSQQDSTSTFHYTSSLNYSSKVAFHSDFVNILSTYQVVPHSCSLLYHQQADVYFPNSFASYSLRQNA